MGILMTERSEGLPLAEICVLVTRAPGQSAWLVDDLKSKGADVRVIPAVTISPLPEPEGLEKAFARIGLYENVIFTSVNGVACTLELLLKEGMGPWSFPPALCVGERTAAAWEKAGGEVAALPERYTAEGLLETLGEDLTGSSFLIMRPEVVRTELGQAMRKLGAEVDEIVLYRTDYPEKGGEDLRDLMAGGGPDVIFFASPSAVEGMLAMTAQSPKPKAQNQGMVEGEKDLRKELLKIPAICIGPTTARAAEDAGFIEVYFPDLHTSEGMVEELLVIAEGIRKPQARSPKAKV